MIGKASYYTNFIIMARSILKQVIHTLTQLFLKFVHHMNSLVNSTTFLSLPKEMDSLCIWNHVICGCLGLLFTEHNFRVHSCCVYECVPVYVNNIASLSLSYLLNYFFGHYYEYSCTSFCVDVFQFSWMGEIILEEVYSSKNYP